MPTIVKHVLSEASEITDVCTADEDVSLRLAPVRELDLLSVVPPDFSFMLLRLLKESPKLPRQQFHSVYLTHSGVDRTR